MSPGEMIFFRMRNSCVSDVIFLTTIAKSIHDKVTIEVGKSRSRANKFEIAFSEKEPSMNEKIVESRFDLDGWRTGHSAGCASGY
jgi:hypothetical protein